LTGELLARLAYRHTPRGTALSEHEGSGVRLKKLTARLLAVWSWVFWVYRVISLLGSCTVRRLLL